MATSTTQRRCVVLRTGGTITTRGTDVLDRNEYMYAGSPIDDDTFLASVPAFEGQPAVEVIALPAKPSHDLTTADQLSIARVVEDCRSRHDVDGVVVQHGTNTLEETAFLLDLLLPHGKPVVIVGSMRPAGVLGSDADTNLIDALRLASDPSSSAHGVLVCLSGQVFAASDVTKADSRTLPGFGDLHWGPLGVVEADGSVFLARRPDASPGLLPALGDLTELPRVDIVLTHTDADGRLIDAAVAAGSHGLVSAGAGAGFPTASELAALRRAAATGVLVCRSSRVATAYAQAPQRTVQDPDPEFVWSGRLHPYQARAVLALALAIGVDRASDTARQLIRRY